MSSTLALVGEAGIGKTALLDFAVECAGGMRPLRAPGIESEAQIPFASLLELASEAHDLALAPEGAPVLVSTRITRAFLRRVDALDAAAQRAWSSPPRATAATSRCWAAPRRRSRSTSRHWPVPRAPAW